MNKKVILNNICIKNKKIMLLNYIYFSANGL